MTHEETVFSEALAQESDEERAAYLDRACADNTRLRRAVEALLAAHARAGGVLEDAAPELDLTRVTSPTTPQSNEATIGTMIGPYKLLEQIGEGGMGVVFMAEQVRPVRRKVALKIIKPGMDTRQVVTRFEAERQALALMDHPNIARVLDGGATAAGRPYFVMELVKGVSITDYCDANRLPARERLGLFVQVCRAVQHAHQKGIIHRDLKPSNVMVMVHDTAPVVKVIDFGIAKALGPELTEKTMFTGLAQMLGTPLYMSPEQAGKSGLDVDTRSDVYALGVLLYELLTGTTPFDAARFRRAAYDEICRIIREEEPPRPSTRLSDLGRPGDGRQTDPTATPAQPAAAQSSLASVSALRHTEPAKLTRLVRGELDWIVMKALEKDRNRRYETASGFAADLERYLADEPVQACPPSARYRFRKFVRRNRRAVVTAAAVGLALLLGVGSFGWVVRDRAAARARTAGEVEQFLRRAESLYADNKLPEAAAEVQKARGVLISSGGANASLEQRVAQWVTDLDTATSVEEIRLGSDDSTTDRDRLPTAYAKLLRNYGIDIDALSVEDAAARIAASRIKPDLVIALDGWESAVRFRRGGQDATLLNKLVAIMEAADPDPWRLQLGRAERADDAAALRALADKADVARVRPRILAHLGQELRFAGDNPAAVALLRRAQRQYPSDIFLNARLAACVDVLDPPQWDEAIGYWRAALAARPQSGFTRRMLGLCLRRARRFDEAVAEDRLTVSLRPGDVAARQSLGLALLEEGKLDEAIESFRAAIAMDPTERSSHTLLGQGLRLQGKLTEAIDAHQTAIKLDPKYAAAYSNLGTVFLDQKRLEEAVAAYATAIGLRPKDTGAAYYNLALALHAQKKWGEATAALQKSIELRPRWALAHQDLGYVLLKQGKPGEAHAAFKKALELDRTQASFHVGNGRALQAGGQVDEAIEAYQAATHVDPKCASAYVALGGILWEQKKLAAALKACRRAIELDPQSAAAFGNLGLVLEEQGNVSDAIVALSRATQLDPENGTAFSNLGSALLSQNRVDEAVAACEKAVKLDPDDALARVNLGQVLAKQGKLSDAIICFHKAIARDARLSQAYASLGDALRDQKKVKEAIDAYRHAARIDPKRAIYFLQLGNVLFGQNEPLEATECYKTVVALEPKMPAAHRNLGRALEAQGKLDDAIAAFRRAKELDPDNARGRTELAKALSDRAWELADHPDPGADTKRAIAAATDALRSDPNSARVGLFLGWVQYRAGNWQGSLEALERSCALADGGDWGQWIVMSLAHAKLAADTTLPATERSRHKAEARRRYDAAAMQIDHWGSGTNRTMQDARAFRVEAAAELGLPPPSERPSAPAVPGSPH